MVFITRFEYHYFIIITILVINQTIDKFSRMRENWHCTCKRRGAACAGEEGDGGRKWDRLFEIICLPLDFQIIHKQAKYL